MDIDDRKMLYNLGRLDGYAEVLTLVWSKGERAALREIAEQLLKVSGANPHPHAKWYLEQQLRGSEL
jgi:hypothetical protein